MNVLNCLRACRTSLESTTLIRNKYMERESFEDIGIATKRSSNLTTFSLSSHAKFLICSIKNALGWVVDRTLGTNFWRLWELGTNGFRLWPLESGLWIWTAASGLWTLGCGLQALVSASPGLRTLGSGLWTLVLSLWRLGWKAGRPAVATLGSTFGDLGN